MHLAAVCTRPLRICQSTRQPAAASLASSSQQQPLCGCRSCQTAAQACPAPVTWLPHQSHPQAGAQASAEPHDEPLLGPDRQPHAAAPQQPTRTGPIRAQPCPGCQSQAACPTITRPDRLQPGSSCPARASTPPIAPLLRPGCQRGRPAAQRDGARADRPGCQHRATGPQRVRPHRGPSGSM